MSAAAQGHSSEADNTFNGQLADGQASQHNGNVNGNVIQTFHTSSGRKHPVWVILSLFLLAAITIISATVTPVLVTRKNANSANPNTQTSLSSTVSPKSGGTPLPHAAIPTAQASSTTAASSSTSLLLSTDSPAMTTSSTILGSDARLATCTSGCPGYVCGGDTDCIDPYPRNPATSGSSTCCRTGCMPNWGCDASHPCASGLTCSSGTCAF